MLGSAGTNAAALVGRIAGAVSSSAVVLKPSPYDHAELLKSLHAAGADLTVLPAASSDPADTLHRLALAASAAGSEKPVSLLASLDSASLASFVAPTVLGLPVVLHLASATGDHTPIELLKSQGYVVIYSGSIEEAQKNVLLASKIALSASHAVVHFFEAFETNGQDLSNKLIQLADSYLAHGAKVNGYTNGHVNGHVNGNGHAASTTNGYVNGNGHASDAVDINRSVNGSSEDHDNLPSSHHSFTSAIEDAYALASKHNLGLAPSHTAGASDSPSKLVLGVGTSASFSAIAAATNTQDIGFLSLSLLRPLSSAALLELIPKSVTSLLVIEQAYSKTTKWSPLYLEVLGAFHASQAGESPRSTPIITSATLGLVGTATASESAQTVQKLLLAPQSAQAAPVLGQLPSSVTAPAPGLAIPKHELAYHKLLSQSFNERLNLLNDLESPSPAQAVGKFLATPRKEGQANWIIGSDSWSYDTGLAGLQTLLSTGIDCNILVVDTSPYPAPKSQQRKKDVGLYALNYGNAYVASVAVYGDYSQTVRALLEAEKFKGPSVVMAYLPGGEDDSLMALDVLKNTKKAMESGFWGLYRYDPSKPEKEAFALDSVKIKKDVQEFLDRQNLLTQLANRLPSYNIPASSLGKKAKEVAQTKAQEAYARLSGALASGPSLLVLYASDGGTAEKLAKKFVGRATARGVNARLEVMDTFAGSDFESIKDQKEDNVVFMTSTAGQGEFPLNGRGLWKGVQAAKPPADNSPDGGEGGWAEIKYAVFGLGDSHYWPRPEDAGYYNKPAKDLDKKLGHDLAIPRLVEELGLGDDQDADGYMTGYKVWEQKVWQALGVAGVDVVEAEPEPITNEHIKIASNYLRGTIKEGLVDTSTGALAESDGQLTKFHGIYQQFDRDIQEERAAQGLEPAYSFMVRVRMPAGVCTPDQWLTIDEISDRRGNGTFKLTTRQTFQFHGIIKANLKPAIQEINKAMLDTIAACGDVNRNVMCSCNPSLGPIHAQIAEIAKNISEHLMPRTNAYAEIWLDKKLVAGDALKDVEPLYGKYYLPRKFKIAIAVPPTNDTDCFCHDIGLIAIVKDGNLVGFNVSIGGGMGVTHSMKKTYPRLGTVIGFVPTDKVVDVCEKIMLVQRDNGDRTNRKHARMKYTVDDMTPAGFKAATEKLLNYQFEAERPYKFESNVDTFGWQTGHDGKKHFTCFIENGRVQDEPGKPFRTGLREIAKVLKEEGGVFRLTANQHTILSDIPAGKTEEKVASLLKKYSLDNLDFSGLRLSSSACVAFPTCGLAMAESERYLPVLIDKLEKIIEENGLRNDSIVMRMTGCPNGCARPWVAESAFVGKAPGSYLWMLGGAWDGTRLSKPYREAVGEEEILAEMRVLIKRYASERLDGERFGDFVIRVGIVKPTLEGKHFYDDSCIA